MRVFARWVSLLFAVCLVGVSGTRVLARRDPPEIAQLMPDEDCPAPPAGLRRICPTGATRLAKFRRDGLSGQADDDLPDAIDYWRITPRGLPFSLAVACREPGGAATSLPADLTLGRRSRRWGAENILFHLGPDIAGVPMSIPCHSAGTWPLPTAPQPSIWLRHAGQALIYRRGWWRPRHWRWTARVTDGALLSEGLILGSWSRGPSWRAGDRARWVEQTGASAHLRPGSEQPCWQGLKPGVDTVDHFLYKVRASGPYTGRTADLGDSIVTMFELSVYGLRNLADIVREWGPPDRVSCLWLAPSMNSATGTVVTAAEVYYGGGLVVVSLVRADQTLRLAPDMRVRTIRYYGPASPRIRTTTDWRGMGPA